MFEEMPSFDVEEELRMEASTAGDLRGGYRFAYKFMTDLGRDNSGTSFVLADGTYVWMLGIRSRGALSINILFSEFELPEGAQVFLYNPARTQVLGAFNHLNNSPLGLLPVSPVGGDEVIIEYREPARATFPGRLKVGEVNHGYKSLKGYEPRGDRSEYYCMASPLCIDDGAYEALSRSVVLLTIDGITACTGVMVNNTLGDGKPYLLTASHCLNKDFSVTNPDYEAVAGRIVCFFNYTSPTCDTLMRGTEEMSVASALCRAVNESSDMALLELAEAPPPYYRPYYAGWSIEENGGTPPYAGIHHPQASVKRINLSAASPVLKTFNIPQIAFQRNGHWNVEAWDAGSTDFGSSGSPLFDSAHRVVGYLSGGSSTCETPTDDYYAAFFKAWESPDGEAHKQLKDWLDPAGGNPRTLDGLDPYAANPSYRLSHIAELKLQDSITVTALPPPASGNLFGSNTLQTLEYAEEYRLADDAQIEGVYCITPAMTDPAGSLDVTITVFEGKDSPQTRLHSETFRPAYLELSLIDSTIIQTEKRLSRAQESFIRFSRPVDVSGVFYVGYKIQSRGNTSFAVYNLPKGMTTRNTAWVNNGGEWIRASSHPLLPFPTSLFIDPVISYNHDDSSGRIDRETAVRIWVDPARERIHVLLPQADSGSCRLYSAGGRLLQETPFSGTETLVPAAGFHPGVYVLQVTGDKTFHAQKIFL
jgi:hypothetical protein